MNVDIERKAIFLLVLTFPLVSFTRILVFTPSRNSYIGSYRWESDVSSPRFRDWLKQDVGQDFVTRVFSEIVDNQKKKDGRRLTVINDGLIQQLKAQPTRISTNSFYVAAVNDYTGDLEAWVEVRLDLSNRLLHDAPLYQPMAERYPHLDQIVQLSPYQIYLGALSTVPHKQRIAYALEVVFEVVHYLDRYFFNPEFLYDNYTVYIEGDPVSDGFYRRVGFERVAGPESLGITDRYLLKMSAHEFARRFFQHIRFAYDAFSPSTLQGDAQTALNHLEISRQLLGPIGDFHPTISNLRAYAFWALGDFETAISVTRTLVGQFPGRASYLEFLLNLVSHELSPIDPIIKKDVDHALNSLLENNHNENSLLAKILSLYNLRLELNEMFNGLRSHLTPISDMAALDIMRYEAAFERRNENPFFDSTKGAWERYSKLLSISLTPTLLERMAVQAEASGHVTRARRIRTAIDQLWPLLAHYQYADFNKKCLSIFSN